MAHPRLPISQFSRLCLSSSVHRPSPILPTLQCTAQTRTYAAAKQGQTKNDLAKAKSRKKGEVLRKKKKPSTTYKQYSSKDLEQFSLLDAMRYLKAAEVGYSPSSAKYDLALKLKSLKNGPVIRNRLRLPHPVRTDIRICVICPSDSQYAVEARAAGAVLVGEDEVFKAVREGRIEFDRCLCQSDSVQKLNASGMGRFLGPRGLMPSAKTGTVVKDPAKSMKELTGSAEYREKIGVIRMSVGQLGFTPEEMQRNIKAVMESVKKDIAGLSDRITKEIAEVVLSSTHGPGMSLDGTFVAANSKISSRQLSTA